MRLFEKPVDAPMGFGEPWSHPAGVADETYEVTAIAEDIYGPSKPGMILAEIMEAWKIAPFPRTMLLLPSSLMGKLLEEWKDQELR